MNILMYLQAETYMCDSTVNELQVEKLLLTKALWFTISMI